LCHRIRFRSGLNNLLFRNRMFSNPGRNFKIGSLAVALASLGLLVGCAGDSDLGDVKGLITLDGAPLENAFISFTPGETEAAAGAAVTFGKTDSEGKYHMIVTDDLAGAYIGSNLVRIKKGGENTFDFDLISDDSGFDQVIDSDR